MPLEDPCRSGGEAGVTVTAQGDVGLALPARALGPFAFLTVALGDPGGPCHLYLASAYLGSRPRSRHLGAVHSFIVSRPGGQKSGMGGRGCCPCFYFTVPPLGARGLSSTHRPPVLVPVLGQVAPVTRSWVVAEQLPGRAGGSQACLCKCRFISVFPVAVLGLQFSAKGRGGKPVGLRGGRWG